MDEDLLLVIKQNGEKLQGNCSHSALLQLQGNFNLKKFQPAEDSFFMVSCIENRALNQEMVLANL